MNDSLATSYPLAVEPSQGPALLRLPMQIGGGPIVVVLGMHRSGTSLCAHILSAMGIDMADAIGEHPSNTRGHWSGGRSSSFTIASLDFSTVTITVPFTTFHCRWRGGRIPVFLR